ncbi:MAG: hypothetical protein ACLP7A_00790 [Desulfobaccales bacterium]
MSNRVTRETPKPDAAVLSLSLSQAHLPRLFPLLQQGFLVKVPGGCNIRTILCQHLGLTPVYLENRIQTIFLNGKPVDEVDASVVGDGATLALSAAMPGLVGATMRKGGYYAALRGAITHREAKRATPEANCLVRIKLFNLLAGELGLLLLEKGIWIESAFLEDFFRNRPADFWEGGLAASLNGRKLDLRALRAGPWPGGPGFICLKVMVRPG